MKHWLLKAVAAGCLIALCLSAPAQSASSTAPHSYRIAGRVVDTITGNPVSRATVTLLSGDYEGAVASAVTGSDGRFAFDNIPPGKYPLSAAKRGYRSAYYDEHDNFNSAIVTGPGLNTGNFEFDLTPGAVIRGVVSDDAGEPVESAQVMLFRPSRNPAAGTPIEQAGATQTDDTGAYEFAGLPAGEYMIAVSAQPWYAQHRSIYIGGTSDPSPLDVAYPVTYYDSTIDESAAMPLKLDAGASEQADINLHAVPALHFRFSATPRPGGNRFFLMQRIFGSAIPVSNEQTTNRQGLVEIAGIAPGTYEADVGDPSRHMVLNANANQDVSLSGATATVTVSGTLSMAGGGPLPSPIIISLKSEHARQQLDVEAENGRFAFEGIEPGTFTIGAASQDKPLAVVSTTSERATTPGSRITVGDHPLSLAVLLTPAQVKVQGFARNGAAPAAGVMIVLVPDDPRNFPALVRRDESDTDGSFELAGVAPGAYTVIAIQDGWNLDWQDRGVFARYLRSGVPLTVTGQSGPVLNLPQPVAVQQRKP